ncbi:MAG: NFACT RNA binding domain-containing protein [Candidatus Micrarchaeia archaeon]
MQIELDYTKTAQENAEEYFKKAKELEKKARGAEEAIEKLEEAKAKLESEPAEKRKLKLMRKKEWYEKFNWFFTTNGMLVISGRSAQQNEELYAKYFSQNDLFFHANIFGASVTLLKNGANAKKEDKEEAAQFAACFSKAWENGLSSIDVFAAKKEQVSKSSQKGYLATGSFLISGEREWFKNMPLELCAFVGQVKIELSNPEANAVTNLVPTSLLVSSTAVLNVIPKKACEKKRLMNAIALKPGPIKKSEIAKELAKKLGFDDLDYIMQHLPAGGFAIER